MKKGHEKGKNMSLKIFFGVKVKDGGLHRFGNWKAGVKNIETHQSKNHENHSETLKALKKTI